MRRRTHRKRGCGIESHYKNVLVIDEAQDMNEDEFSLIEALIRHNDDMRIIAVGDDDQSIYEFRHASPNISKAYSGIRSHEIRTG